VANDGHEGEEALADAIRAGIGEEAEAVARAVEATEPLSAERASAVLAKVQERQKTVGYEGSSDAWMAKVTPPDMT
jgi:hypothetical protein